MGYETVGVLREMHAPKDLNYQKRHWVSMCCIVGSELNLPQQDKGSSQ